MPTTIDDYIERRNAIQLQAENKDEDTAKRCRIELGVANRHIARVLEGTLSLTAVESEIEATFRRVKRMFGFSK